jgi:hypothetical protein
MSLILALLGCDPQPVDLEPDDGVTLLTPRQQLMRLSVDLRGVHPSEAELAAIEANPALYEQFVDRYLQDPRFLDRMESVFHAKYLTRTGDTYGIDVPGFGMMQDDPDVARSIANEPLKLVRKIVDEDLPYTEIVLADYTMSDAITAKGWGTDRPTDAEGWVPAHYKDGRETAGVLSMTTMWTRYPSAGVNSNRHRANQTSRILLCDDYLARPVSFSRSQIDALTSGDPEDVIRDNSTCQSCHSSLDPMAAHFYGYWWEVDGSAKDMVTYRPEDEELWRDHADRAPAYFGIPTHGIRELAENLAADPRLEQCAVKTVFEGITQRTVVDADWTELSKHDKAFYDSGLVVRALVRSIVLDRPYLAAEVDGVDGERVPTVKTADPAQLASIVRGITGYSWEFDGRDALTDNLDGLGVLAGGIDARYVTKASHDPSVGTVFVQERLAQAAAYHVARHDLDPDRSEPAILLRYVTADDTPETDRAAFEGQIRSLYLEITGEALPDEAPEVDELIGVWKQLYSVEASPVLAWAGVTSAILRDPAVLFY